MTEKIGKILGIYIGEKACQSLQSMNEVEAVAGRGLRGDRYFLKQGCFSNYRGRGRHLTLIESEVLESLDPDLRISVEDARRNVLTENVDLNSLVGSFFQIGELVLRGDRLCHPCEYLQALTQTPVLTSLKGRGGLRADIVKGGLLAVGMLLTPLPGDWSPEKLSEGA